MAKPSASPERIDLKRLRLRDGDILVIREPATTMREREEFRVSVLGKLKRNLVARNVIILFSSSLSDVKALSPEQLARVGLQRIPDDS